MKLKLLAFGGLLASLCASVQGQLVDKTPRLHLSFDNVSGTTVINDGSGGTAMNGTLNGAGATIVPGGKFGNCLSITGTASPDASVRIANAVVPLNASGQWTVAMWVQTYTPGGAYAYQGDGGWGAGNSTFYANLGGTGSGTKSGGVRNSQGWVTGTKDITDGLWHHVVVTCNGSTRTLYVDGAQDGTDADWAGNGTGNQFWIGGGGTGQNDGQVNLNGLIDEAYVFDQALSLTDIQQLYNNNTVPTVPVTVTLNPTSSYRGQTFTVTASATPGVGTVTNATVNLSPIGLSATSPLVQSSVNVFTNTFTVPNNTTAPIGAALLKVTVTSSEPLIGSGGATFTVKALPPTNAIVRTDLTNTTAHVYTAATFYFATTNDAPNQAPFPMTYAWYKNSTLVSTNPMGPYYSFLTTPNDDGAQVYAIARVADTNFSSISVTSAVVTLTVISGTPVYTNGLKQEVFRGATRNGIEIGNVGPGIISLATNADSSGGYGDNTSRRYSGYFIPKSSDGYVFYLASDDDCDLFLSTDETPEHKRLIAQETAWSGTRVWLNSTASINSQKRSDQWTNSLGETPYISGIPLTAGQKYYIEAVMHNGGGGDNWAMTYETMSELTLDPTQPTDGSASRMTAASNNLAVATWPGTTLNWSLQPKPSVTVNEGQSTNFTAIAISDEEMTPKYQWFLVTSGGSLPGTALTGNLVNGTNLTMSLIPASYNNAQVYCVATLQYGGLSITSSPAVLHVIQSVFEPGWVSEKKWLDQFNMAGLEAGTVGAPTFSAVRAGFLAGLDNPGTGGGSGHDSMIQQIGYFVPPSSGNYVFFITSHDGGDLFLSTDNTAVKKRLIAQEAGWSGNFAWNQAGGGGTIISQKRSDTFTNSTSGGVPPYAAGIPLTAGQRYYMEVDHTTSKWGNEQFGVSYQLMSGAVTPPADGTPPNATGNVVGMSAIRCTYVAFTQQPANVQVAPMGYATFSVSGATDSQYPVESSYGYTIVAPTNALFYQWYKNGVAIPGANSATLTLGPIQPSDSGATVYCSMRALGFADNSLNPIWTNSQPATLTVPQPGVFEPGYLTMDWWTNGATRASVESGSAGAPSFSFVAPALESPATGSSRDNYANRASGWFTPTNGDYVFYVNSDDDSDLFIGSDSTPASRRLVAQESGWSGNFAWNQAGGGGSVIGQKRSDQWSPDGGLTVPWGFGIHLNEGQKYWLEGVHHEGTGGDNFAATFAALYEPVTDGSRSKFTGNWIGTYVPRLPWVAFLQQPVSQMATSGGNPVTFTALGTNPPSVWIGTTGDPTTWLANPRTDSVQYQWYKNGSPIPGATNASYTQPYVLTTDQGAQFVCGMRALGYSDDSFNRIYSNSVPAVLTVVTDNVPPTIAYAVSFQNTNQVPPQYIIDVTFSEWMDGPALSNALSYTISGVNITNVSVASNHRTVQLLVDAMPTLPLNVTVNGVKDLSGNTIASSSSIAINGEKLNFSDVGTPNYDPAYPSYVWVSGAGSYLVSAQGSDIWNALDACNFGWELKTNDFDMVVRGVSITPTSQYAKMGLMIRETLDSYSREWSIQNEPLAAVGGANRIDTAMRESVGGTSANWALGTLPPPSYPNAWLRLKRTGSRLDGYYSTNGVTWVNAAAYDSSTNVAGAISNVVYVGICTTAHNNDVVSFPPPEPFLYYNTAEYANYTSSFVPSAPPAQLTVTRSGSNVTISWTPAGGHLEGSPAISGPGVNWQTIGTSNPAIIPIGTDNRFFRVVNP